MKHLAKLLLSCISIACIASTHLACAQTPVIKIVSPPNDTVVEPGQRVTMEVKVDPMSGIRSVVVGGPDPLAVVGLAKSPPYRFTFTIPKDMPLRPYIFTAGGNTLDEGEMANDSITLDVEKTNPIISLEVHPSEFILVEPGERHTLNVTGTFDDGTKAHLSESTRITYSSDHPEVATVDSMGRVICVTPGKANITISAGSVSAVVSAIFLKDPPSGPKTTMTLTPPPNAKGWNNNDIQVNVATVDDMLGSGVKEIGLTVAGNHTSKLTTIPGPTASTTVSVEGDLRITAYAVDHAGNIGHQIHFDVLLDKTPPSINGLPAPCVVRIKSGDEGEEKRIIV